MARARQARRLARTWAATLGYEAGADAVDSFASELDATTRTGELLFTISDGAMPWDEPARNAHAAQLCQCPKGFEEVFYCAYVEGAHERVKQWERGVV